MSTVSPLRNQRLLALALSAAWFTISGSIGLNALIKSNQTQTRFRKEAPAGVTLEFHVNDLYQPGVVLTSVCTILAVLSAIFFLVTLVWPKRATGSLKIQAGIFTFFSVWLFATQIPYTVFVATHRAKIDAFLGGVQLPAQTVQGALAAAGESDKYSKLHPAVLLAIFPWISLVFVTILILVLLAAARRCVPLETASEPPPSGGEKADLST
ncbi:hypothetical protein BC826DRAFT_1105740 [Russula brevipes]|nr:hypothetical protein BC826DRAFT_1105740 [Russula brevipes]